MNAECIRHLFVSTELSANSDDIGYIDWFVWERGSKNKRRLFILTYDIQNRSFYSVLERSDEDDSDFNLAVQLPHKITELLKSFLTPADWGLVNQAGGL